MELGNHKNSSDIHNNIYSILDGQDDFSDASTPVEDDYSVAEDLKTEIRKQILHEKPVKEVEQTQNSDEKVKEKPIKNDKSKEVLYSSSDTKSRRKILKTSKSLSFDTPNIISNETVKLPSEKPKSFTKLPNLHKKSNTNSLNCTKPDRSASASATKSNRKRTFTVNKIQGNSFSDSDDDNKYVERISRANMRHSERDSSMERPSWGFGNSRVPSRQEVGRSYQSTSQPPSRYIN